MLRISYRLTYIDYKVTTIKKTRMNNNEQNVDEREMKKTEAKTETNPVNIQLIHFEEFALSLEEHFHAQLLFANNPSKKPLGHR
tara:strand:+ start:303 stop:554 length:252 start_codon:yes stop_codon:yes gene_type:complete